MAPCGAARRLFICNVLLDPIQIREPDATVSETTCIERTRCGPTSRPRERPPEGPGPHSCTPSGESRGFQAIGRDGSVRQPNYLSAIGRSVRVTRIKRSSTEALEAAAVWLTHISPPKAVALCLLVIAVLGGLDVLSVREANIGAFYVLPVCMAAWALGLKAGLAAAGAAALMRAAAYADDLGQISSLMIAFNTLSALVAYGAVALLLGAVRGHFDDTRVMADTDPLTGALNKRAFMEAVDSALADLERRGGSLLLAYVDLDGFKAVNDGAGHAAGDEVLRAFASAAHRELADGDVIGRVGGDEFVLLRWIDDLADGYVVAEAMHDRLCDSLEQLPYGVTCSIGAVIARPGDVAGHQRLLGLADALMYEVKHSGKNSLRLALASDNHGFAPPRKSPGEAARQAAVDRLDLVGLTGLPSLQAIVEQAAAIIGVPIAAISIIDRGRQWFVADTGLDADATPRAVSFCGHAIHGEGPMVVNDATLDARFGGNPLVRGEPGIRFYAGAPLMTAAGQTLGTLCVIDTRPRELTTEQTAELGALAARVTRELEAASRPSRAKGG